MDLIDLRLTGFGSRSNLSISYTAIKQLPKHVNSAELIELINKRAPLKIECKVCLLAKHTQQIS
jgi:hypothetical protein